MTTTTLSSKGRFKNLLLGMLRKNLSMSVYLFAILFFFFPLQMILEVNDILSRLSIEGQGIRNYYGGATMGIYTDVSLFTVIGIMTLVPVIIGLVQCSYLHSKRAVDLYHSLPVTRVQLMSASTLAAFITVTVPFLLNYLINLCVALYRQSILGEFAEPLKLSLILWDVFGWLTVVFAILAVVMLVATQVGSVFENFVFSCELLGAPLIIILLNELLFEQFLMGYVSQLSPRAIASSTPIGIMVGRLMAYDAKHTDVIFSNWVIVIWLLLSTAIFVGALLLYRRRRSEIAETPGCKGMVGSVLTVLAVYIGGIGLGGLLWSFTNTENEVSFVVWTAIGSVLVFLLVEAILNRGFAGLRRCFPRGAAICAFVTLTVAMVTAGGFGYETRLPVVGGVESVTFSYRGWYDYVRVLDTSTEELRQYEDNRGISVPHYSYRALQTVTLRQPESLELIRQIHSQVVADGRMEVREYNELLDFSYQLKHGRMARHYYIHGEETLQLLLQLQELPEFQQQTNPLLYIRPEMVEQIDLYDGLGFHQGKVDSQTEVALMLEALKQDALANGTRDFTARSPVVGYLYIDAGDYEPYGEQLQPLTENRVTSFSLPIFAGNKNLAAVLQSIGKEAMLQPVDAGVVTGLGINGYYDYKGEGNSMVARVDPYKDSRPARPDDQEIFVTATPGLTQEILEQSTRFTEIFSHTYYQWYYVTLFRGEEQGITVMIAPELLPKDILEKLPEDAKEQILKNTSDVNFKY